MDLKETYEEILYPNLAFAQTHPDRLATLTMLLGLKPADITNCRVLELGCASGGNLIPMAYGLPDSKFIGVDFAHKQIQQGQTMINKLGLSNITLQQLDIREVGPEFGQFDYILVHGIYSWVPPEVRESVLKICQQNLAPHGIAYVSYNAYPGWHMLGIIRDMMLFHSRNATDPYDKAAQAKAALDFLKRAVPKKATSYARFLIPYVTFLQEQFDRVGSKADEFLIHDELELYNDAIYFHQFADHAAQYDLQYVTEAELSTVMPNRFEPEIMQEIQQMSNNIIEMEQYMDFARNRVFRQTLLCHAELEIKRTMNAERILPFYVASRAKAMSDSPVLYTPSIEEFESYNGSKLSLEHPVSKTAMMQLIKAWPEPVSFKTLLKNARTDVEQHQGLLHEAHVDAEHLAINLLKAYSYSHNLVEFHVYRPPFTLQVSDYPTASPVARYQAHQNTKVTNLYQEGVKLDNLNAYLIRHLDGKHNQQDLLALLNDLVASGTLELKPKEPLTPEFTQEQFLTNQLSAQLRWFANAALLVA